MSRNKDQVSLIDIINACRKIIKYKNGLDKQAFLKNKWKINDFVQKEDKITNRLFLPKILYLFVK